jgi:hypothetical protein
MRILGNGFSDIGDPVRVPLILCSLRTIQAWRVPSASRFSMEA